MYLNKNKINSYHIDYQIFIKLHNLANNKIIIHAKKRSNTNIRLLWQKKMSNNNHA